MNARIVKARELAERMRAAPDSHAGQKPVGFWTPTKETPPERGRIWPGTLVDSTWDVAERVKVIAYLKEPHGWKIGYMGCSWCRLCEGLYPKRELRSGDKLADWECLGSHDLGDGIYVWPEGFVHYVETHGVKPPQEFIDHVLNGGSFIEKERRK